jgi:hydroxymethylpyrimidine/phosphomethylpyrimidine kinase
VLCIAGSDSAGASGVQADLRTLQALGCYGTTALTAVTAQNTRRVRAVVPLGPGLVKQQIDAVLADVGTDVVKTGMLWSGAIARAVAQAVPRRAPLVVDPVLRASTGATLSQDGLVGALRKRLLPIATLVTPNLPEAEALVGFPVRSRAERRRAARELLALGAGAVLLKGGHGRERGLDLLAWRERGRERMRWLRGPRYRTRHTRGTGCTLATACAAHLARGLPLPRAVAEAKAFVSAALRAGSHYRIGHGPGPLFNPQRRKVSS